MPEQPPHHRAFGNHLLAATLSFAAACGDPAPSERPSPSPETPETAAESAKSISSEKGPRFGEVKLHAGFSPDPHIVEGKSGGEIDASTLRAECKGWVASRPDFLLQAKDAFTELRVMAHAEGDVTLLLTEPDGDLLCNDDTEPGRTPDPLLRAAIEPGTYEVRVGSFARGEDVAYKLAFSELTDMDPSKLAH